MKICLVDHESSLGGAEKSMVDICAHLDKNEFEVIVAIQKEGEFANALRNGGVHRIYFLPMDGWRWWRRGLLERIKLFLKLPEQCRIIQKWVDFFRKEKPDIIHFNLSRLIEPITAAKIVGIPSILHYRENTNNQKSFFGGIKSLFHHLNQCDYWIANSNYTYREIAPYAKNKNIKVIRNAIVLPEICQNLERNAFPKGQLVIVNVSGLVPWKNHVLLFDLMKHLVRIEPKSHLYCYGKGSEEWTKVLRSEILQRQLQNHVTLAGFSDNLHQILPQADIMVHSSGGESFGRVYIEGMWAGLVVFALEGDAAEEIIEDGVDGFIYSKENLNAVAQKIVSIHKNQKIKKDIVERAIKKVKEEYDISRLINELTNFYRKIGGQK